MAALSHRAILTIVILGSALLHAAQSPQPAFDPSTANLPIRDMHLMSASEGWVLAGEHILWTDTDGQSWTDITPPLATGQVIDTVYFLAKDHGWAVLHAGDIGDSPIISLAATADGGKSWSGQALPLSQFLRSLYWCTNYLSFVDDMHGWILVRRMSGSAYREGELFVTGDAGKTWSKLPTPPIGGKIQFVSQSTGWIFGGVHGDELYRTRDGGQTWLRTVIPLPDEVHPYTVPSGNGPYVLHPVYEGLLLKRRKRG